MHRSNNSRTFAYVKKIHIHPKLTELFTYMYLTCGIEFSHSCEPASQLNFEDALLLTLSHFKASLFRNAPRRRRFSPWWIVGQTEGTSEHRCTVFAPRFSNDERGRRERTEPRGSYKLVNPCEAVRKTTKSRNLPVARFRVGAMADTINEQIVWLQSMKIQNIPFGIRSYRRGRR